MKYSFMLNSTSKYEIVKGILEKAPVAGLYMNESPAKWDNFFNFFCKFLQSEEGPRGEVIKLSREYLKKDEETTKQIIKPLGLVGNDYLIRDVYVKFKQYIPTPLYTRYQIDSQKLKEIQNSSKLIVDSNSLMYKNIEKGLLQKHGQDYDVETKMKQITETYLTKFAERQENVQRLGLELKCNQEYKQYQVMRKYLEPVIQLFDKVQKQIGTANVERGKMFQQKCKHEGLEQLYSRIGRNNFEIATNCRWDPSELGEVDIALIETINGEKTVTVLVECKARLFDLCAAMKQIGPERIQKNKRFIRKQKNIIPVLDDAQYFVMTGLPSNQYHLPFQSRLKVELEKATKTFSFSELDSKKIYNLLFPKFQNQISPLEWFNKEANKHLIII